VTGKTSSAAAIAGSLTRLVLLGGIVRRLEDSGMLEELGEAWNGGARRRPWLRFRSSWGRRREMKRDREDGASPSLEEMCAACDASVLTRWFSSATRTASRRLRRRARAPPRSCLS
jgi:hypothetical protein